MFRQLLQMLNVKDDEQSAIQLLLAHSFFIGIFLAFFFSYASGAFLGEFGTSMLPYAYIATGLTGFAASSIFGTLQQRIPYPRLLVGTLFSLLVLMVLFFVGVQATDSKWLIFVIYIFIIPFYTMIALQYWGMVMKMFDLRQGKRLFGLIGSGDVVSSLIGFSAVPLILNLANKNTSVLLFLGSIGLAIGIIFQFRIIKRFSHQLDVAKSEASQKEKKRKGSLKDIFNNKYFTLIFILTICSVFGQNFVDYNFMGLARATFKKEELTAFFGIFFAIIKVVELISKTALAGRLLNQYGLKFGLRILPTLLLIFSVLAVVLSLFGADLTLLFIPLAMNKLFDRAVRKSLDEPSVKVLYQPLEAETKLVVQTQAEGKAKQIAIVASGLILIVFNFLGFGTTETVIFLCAILAVWVLMSKRMYEGYRSTIKEKLTGDELHQAHSADDAIGVRFLANQLAEESSEEKIETAVRLAELLEPGAIAPLIPKLIAHPSPIVKRQALKVVLKNQLLDLAGEVREVAQSEGIEELKNDLVDAEITLHQIKQLREEEISMLVRDAEPSNRHVAAVWLGYFDHPQRLLLLRELASDKHLGVAMAAVKSSASVKSIELWSLLIEFMHIPTLSNVAVPALVAEGQDVIPVLEMAFSRFEKKPLALLKIVQICGRIGGERAIQFLFNQFDYPEREVQITIANMLLMNQFRASGEQESGLKAKIESEVNYATWLMATILDLNREELRQEYLVKVLKDELSEVNKHIFRLLSMLYDADSILRIQQNLQRNTKESVALAMEMVDILLDENLKELIAPLIDQMPLQEKLIKLQNFFPQKRFRKAIERLRNIIYYDFSKLNRWVKACAIHQVMKLSNELHSEIEALVFHEDFFLKETALIALHHAKPSRYQFYTAQEKKKDKIKYDRVTGYNRKLERIPSNFQEVTLMRRNDFLDKLPATLLVKLSELAEQEAVEIGQQPDYKYLKGNRVHFVVEGQFQLIHPDKTKESFRTGDAIGLLEDIDMEKCEFNILRNTKIFYMDKAAFYTIAQAHSILVKAIYESLTQTEAEALDEDQDFEKMSHVVTV